MLNHSLKLGLASTSYCQELQEIMDYAVFPPGKLFRPKLVEALSLDLNHDNKNYLNLGTAIEIHHAYTLVHDDLPAMDNDLMRRGKPSTHAAYGEWQAILTGDALLIQSFQELFKIDHPKISALLKFFSWATGGKGLVCGQFLDLSTDGKNSLQEIIRIHELKTARLIQVATVGSYLLSPLSYDFKNFICFLRLGREIGVSFQLLDDLGELTENEVSPHEKNVNPFLLWPDTALNELSVSLHRLKNIMVQKKLVHLEKMLNAYFVQNREALLLNFVTLEKNIGKRLNSKTLSDFVTSLGHV
jgi:geranylgeranyl pyrophosphate synthase